MSDRWLTVEFDHTGPMLTYGPSEHDIMAHIITHITMQTGGFENHWDVTPKSKSRILTYPYGDKEEIRRHYKILFGIPKMAAALYQADYKSFMKLLKLERWQLENIITNLEQ